MTTKVNCSNLPAHHNSQTTDNEMKTVINLVMAILTALVFAILARMTPGETVILFWIVVTRLDVLDDQIKARATQ